MIADFIEDIRDADIAIVAKIHAACFHDAWGPAMLRQVLAMPGAFGLVARWGGHDSLVGFSLSRVVADECELLSLGIAPEHRARGIGTLLFKESIVQARARNAARFFLEVAEDNEPALRMYRAHGMTEAGRRPEYYENPNGLRTTALTMRCNLTG